ncbi:Serine/threonine-protein phosphatase 6 regulatory ankyrin repeat subunit B, partial [Stegodyphus mimosarum]
MIKLLTEESPAYVLEKTDDEKKTVLDVACSHSCPEVVEYLLSQGSSVHVNNFRGGPVLSAVMNIPDYAVPIASMVLDAGANINLCDYMGRTALMFVIRLSALKVIKSGSQKYSYSDLFMLLIERGCDVNASYDFGKTALHLAVLAKQEILVRKLLISGADIDRRDAYGLTPLFYACESGS